jgi:hypothetical protein
MRAENQFELSNYLLSLWSRDNKKSPKNAVTGHFKLSFDLIKHAVVFIFFNRTNKKYIITPQCV